MSVQEYLEKHLLSRKIEEAVNAAVRAKTPGPVLFISTHMRRAAPAVITRVRARQILDSRGAPAVEVDLHTNKAVHRASAAGAGAPEGAAVDASRDAEKRRLLARVVASAGDQRQGVGGARGDGSAAAGTDRPGHHGLGQGAPQG